MLVMPCHSRRRGGQNDEKGNRIGEEHADDGVDLDAVKLPDGRLWLAPEADGYLALIHFLDFLRGLPEKTDSD